MTALLWAVRSWAAYEAANRRAGDAYAELFCSCGAVLDMTANRRTCPLRRNHVGPVPGWAAEGQRAYDNRRRRTRNKRVAS